VKNPSPEKLRLMFLYFWPSELTKDGNYLYMECVGMSTHQRGRGVEEGSGQGEGVIYKKAGFVKISGAFNS